MLKRWWIVAALLLAIPWTGCKKSEGTRIQNFFGAPPEVSEVSISKERRDFQCVNFVDLCSCCCLSNIDVEAAISIDLVTASARVVDPTPPDGTNPSDILVVVLRFLDPPPSAVPPGTQINQVSFEMFDTGPIAVGHLTLSDQSLVDIHSGDLTAGDGMFTRKFYFGTSTSANAGTCLEETDRTDLNHTYSTYSTSRDVSPSNSLTFQFTAQAIDRGGNIDTSSELLLPVQGTFRESVNNGSACCPSPCPPNTPAGCAP